MKAHKIITIFGHQNRREKVIIIIIGSNMI